MSERGKTRGGRDKPVTRIAGTLLRLYRVEQNLSADELAFKVDLDPATISRAENGYASFRSFCDNMGAYADMMQLSTDDVVLLLNAIWVDVLFDAIAGVEEDDGTHPASRLRLLQSLWHHREARRWLNVLLFDDPPPWLPRGRRTPRVPCLARHPAMRRRVQRAKGSNQSLQLRAGPRPLEPTDVLRQSLLAETERPRATNRLRQVVLDALHEATNSLRTTAGEKPKLGDLLRLFAEVARKDERARRFLARELHDIPPEKLHPVDERYRARALDLLGDGQALCTYVASIRTRRPFPPSVLDYYRERTPGDHEGTQAISSFCSRIEFALSIQSAPLAAFYLTAAAAFLEARIPGKAKGARLAALANFYTTRRLFVLSGKAESAGSASARSSAGAWAQHRCASQGQECREVAVKAARQIRKVIVQSAQILKIKGFKL